MNGFPLRKGMAFEWNGVAYRIKHLGPNGQVVVERLIDANRITLQRSQLLADYVLGRISLAFNGGNVRPAKDPDGSIAFDVDLKSVLAAARERVDRLLGEISLEVCASHRASSRRLFQVKGVATRHIQAEARHFEHILRRKRS